MLATPLELKEASVLHRALQYNRLRSTKHFLALERKRRQLAYQREYRDLSAFLKDMEGRLPEERADLEGVTPRVKNLPTNVSREHLQITHPHTIPTNVDILKDLLRLMEGELRGVGVISTVEKERLLSQAVRYLVWVYKRMMKDKAKGYYRIMMTPPPHDIKVAGEVDQPPPPIRQVSSALRAGRINGTRKEERREG